MSLGRATHRPVQQQAAASLAELVDYEPVQLPGDDLPYDAVLIEAVDERDGWSTQLVGRRLEATRDRVLVELGPGGTERLAECRVELTWFAHGDVNHLDAGARVRRLPGGGVHLDVDRVRRPVAARRRRWLRLYESFAGMLVTDEISSPGADGLQAIPCETIDISGNGARLRLVSPVLPGRANLAVAMPDGTLYTEIDILRARDLQAQVSFRNLPIHASRDFERFVLRRSLQNLLVAAG
jgi:hypothetical protein